MVVPTVVRDWTGRLAHLRQLVATEPRGPTWLWRIRIRILRYLVARYGEPKAPGAVEIEPQEAEPEVGEVPLRRESPPPVVSMALLPPSGVEHPPKPRGVITPILADIHELNEDRRLAEGSNVLPGIVWSWWRSEWCLR